MDRAKGLSTSKEFQDLADHYCKVMMPHRGVKYISVFSEYFSSYSEFAQVQFLITADQPVDPKTLVSSVNFSATKMFYGNTFETFGDLVDLIALLNNVALGRTYDTFERLTMKQYYQIDKSGRTKCFSEDPTLKALAIEFDSQFRNASHHGGLQFDPTLQTIMFRAGKGGQGTEQSMSYTEYLSKCVRITMQLVNLLQFELLIASSRKQPGPV